jgi:hypothetical protein
MNSETKPQKKNIVILKEKETELIMFKKLNEFIIFICDISSGRRRGELECGAETAYLSRKSTANEEENTSFG